MHVGYIGLGKMGSNMVLRLLEQRVQVTAWNRSPEPRAVVVAAGAHIAETVTELVQSLSASGSEPRIVWLMLPAGKVTHEMIIQLSELLAPNDIVIDGSNNFYQESIAHAKLLKVKKIRFLDAGVSGGPHGARTGACVMVGGDPGQFSPTEHKHFIEPLIKAISAPDAYGFFPGVGAGHFLKMIHNGIEYGMMQAIGEGFSVLKSVGENESATATIAPPFHFDLHEVAELYNHGSVIESRLMGWLASGYQKHGDDLADVSGSVHHSGEGQWTVETAQELHVPTPVIKKSLEFRMESQQNPSYIGKVVSVLRNEFGGHEVKI